MIDAYLMKFYTFPVHVGWLGWIENFDSGETVGYIDLDWMIHWIYDGLSP